MTRSSRDIKSPVKVQIANALQFTQAEHSQEEIDVFLGQVKSILNTENPESRFYTHSSEYHEFVKHVIGKAIFANQVGLVKSLLEDDHGYGFRYDAILKNMPEHSRYEDKYSLMEAAVLAGNLEIVKLIDAAIKRRHPDPSEYPHRELIQKLNYQGISLAVRTGNLDIVNYFLNKGASIDTVVDIYSYRKDTLIAHAAKHGHAQVLDALMAHATFNSISYAFGHMDDKYKDPIRYGRENLEQYSDEKRQEIIAKIAVRDEKFGEYEAELTKFDTEKQKKSAVLRANETELAKILEALLDYAVGYDFSDFDLRELLQPIAILKSVKGLNFIGVSIDGKPVTHEILKSYNFTDVDDAIVTLDDIYKIQDPVRREALQSRINHLMDVRGSFIKDNIVNLIPLYRAVANGEMEVVNARLANQSADPNESYIGHGIDEIPILRAASKGREDMVSAIISHPNFDINMFAAAATKAKDAGHKALAAMLEKKKEEADLYIKNINTLDKNNKSPLHRAIDRCNLEEVKRLIRFGANVNIDGSGGTPLRTVVAADAERTYVDLHDDYMAILRFLLDHGANPDLKKYDSKPIDIAGTKDALFMLLPITKKEDVITTERWSDKKVSLPWYANVIFNHIRSKDLFEVLTAVYAADAAVDFNVRSSAELSLLGLIIDYLFGYIAEQTRYADKHPDDVKTYQYYEDAIRGYWQSIDFLLSHGVDCNLNPSHHETTVLHSLMKQVRDPQDFEVRRGVFDKCLQHGFKIDTPDDDGKTLLHLAAEQANLPALQYLLDHGANANSKDKIGRTALHYVSGGHLHQSWTYETSQMIDMLRRHQARKNIIDMNGQTPLILMNVESRKLTQPLQKEEADALALAKATLRHSLRFFAKSNNMPAKAAAKPQTPQLK